MRRIAAAIVSYFSDGDALTATVLGLARASAHAGSPVRLTLVDNTDAARDSARLDELILAWRASLPADSLLTIARLSPGSNRGYGAGNNAALTDLTEDIVLVLNPDAVLEADALREALQALAARPDCALIAPRAFSPEGSDLYLGHGHPSLLALAGRSMRWLRQYRVVSESIARYELRDADATRPHERIVCASGCFMLMPAWSWRASGGFDPAFFLYFEDYDLSMRLRDLGCICYAPAVRLVHLGGDASGKGWRHTRLFITSAARFFMRYGWRWQ